MAGGELRGRLDLKDGKILWTRQLTQKDAYTAACRLPDKTNCPSVKGPDYDFASSPILVTLEDVEAIAAFAATIAPKNLGRGVELR